MSMITSQATHLRIPIGAALLHARAPSTLLYHGRCIHTPSPLRQELQSKSEAKASKEESAKVVSKYVAEEVLRDQYEPGWAMHHPKYTKEGEFIPRAPRRYVRILTLAF
jgi:hypothetical protein